MANFIFNIENSPSFSVSQTSLVETDCASQYTYRIESVNGNSITIELVGTALSASYTIADVVTSGWDGSSTSVTFDTYIDVEFIINNSGTPGVFNQVVIYVEDTTLGGTYDDTVIRQNDSASCDSVGGSSDFDGLTDTPDDKSDSALFLVRVNATEDALEYINPSEISPLTTKGDIYTYSSTNGNDRLPIGTDGYRLVADSAQDTGLIWEEVTEPAIISGNEGSGVGYFIDQDRTEFSVIGEGSIDLQFYDSTSGLGVEADYSFAVGLDNIIGTGAGGGSGNFGAHVAIGSTNVVQGYFNNIAFGTFNNIQDGYSFFATGYGNTVDMEPTVGIGAAIGLYNDHTEYWNFTMGVGLRVNTKGTTAVGMASTEWTGGITDANRPALIVGIGDVSSASDATFGDILSSADGLTVNYDGTVYAPSLTTTLIDSEASTSKVLITKEWFGANSFNLHAPSLFFDRTAEHPQLPFTINKPSDIDSWDMLGSFESTYASEINSNEIYVDAVKGSDLTGTGSVLKPFKTITPALNTAGSYVYLQDGDYDFVDFRNTSTQGDKAKIFIGLGDNVNFRKTGDDITSLTFTQSLTDNHTFEATLITDNLLNVITRSDRIDDFNLPEPIRKYNTTAEVETNGNGFHYNSTTKLLTIKIQEVEGVDQSARELWFNDNIKPLLSASYSNNPVGFSRMFLYGSLVFMKNIKVEGAYFYILQNAGVKPRVWIEDSILKYATSTGFTVDGGSLVAKNLVVYRSLNDNIGYHVSGGVESDGVEIDVISCYAGDPHTNGFAVAENKNGSSMHENGNVFRYRGNYFRNHGPNIVDTGIGGTSTGVSWNIGCRAFDSTADVSNFDIVMYDRDVYVDHCVANTIVAADNSTIYNNHSSSLDNSVLANGQFLEYRFFKQGILNAQPKFEDIAIDSSVGMSKYLCKNLFKETVIEELSLEGYSETGVRSDATFLVEIGDYDESNGGVYMSLDNDTGYITAYNCDFNLDGNINWDNGTNTGALRAGTLTANRTYDLPDASGTVALTSDIVHAQTKVSLTAAQILASDVTPITAISAQGTGTAINIVNATVRLNFNTTAFDGAGSGLLIQTVGAATQQASINRFVINSASTTIIKSSISDSSTTGQLVENADVELQWSGTVPTTGDGTLDVYITYEVITL